MLVARLLDRSEVAHVVEASLGERVSLVPLDARPESDAAQPIELHAPDLDGPIVLSAEPAGDPVAGMYPLLLRPLDERNAEDLRAFLRASLAPPPDPEPERPSLPPAAALVPEDEGPAAVIIEDEPPALAVVGDFEGMGRLGAPERLTGALEEPTAKIPTPPPPSWPPRTQSPDLVFRAPLELGNLSETQAVSTDQADEALRLADRLRTDSSGARQIALDEAPTSVRAPPIEITTVGGEPVFEPDPLLGRVLGGKYEIKTLLGRGGTGNVYRARHVALDKAIAVKVLHAAFQADPQFAQRFHREALATSKLDHPNVLRVLDFGQESDGLLYIAMELLAGQDLQTILDTSGPMALPRCIEVMSQVCAALTAAHEIGIVHRDIKPENVVVIPTRDDEGTIVDHVKVCDFGIAKLQERPERKTAELRKLTAVGTIWGTPHYMSPEQARALGTDARSDIYSCGVILYEMTTGRVPFTDESALGVAMKHVTEAPLPPSTVNPGIDLRLEAVILRAMQKEPGRRQQNARELRAELRALLEQLLDEKTVRRDVPPGRGLLDAKTEVSPPPIDAEPTSVTRVDAARHHHQEIEDDRPAVAIVDDVLEVEGLEARAAALPVAPSAPAPVPADEGPIVSLDDHSSGFAEFFIALTAAIARTSYYERGHPEFEKSLAGLVRAAGPALRRRGEVSVVRRDIQHEVRLGVQTGLGEVFELKKVVPVSVLEAHGLRMADVFERRHLISITFKEGIVPAEIADTVELLSGPEMRTEQLRNHFLSRALRNVSVLFAADLLGRDRRLPWEVDLCISRLARDLRVLPMLRGVDVEGMRKLRAQLIGDVIRTLRGPEQVKHLLTNSDLVGAAVQHIPELAALDLQPLIVATLPHKLCTRVAGVMLAEFEQEVAAQGTEDPAEGAPAQSGVRKIVHVIGARLVRERTVESDDVLRELHQRSILSFPELPPDLQLWILAEQQAEALVKNAEGILRSLDSTFDEARYAREVGTLDRAMRVLARRGEAAALWAVVARLERHARGAEPSDSSREGLAARSLKGLADPEVLAPIAEALLAGSLVVRDPSRGILVSAGADGAQALCDARTVKGKGGEVGRPRFVATLREMGAAAVPAITGILSAIDPIVPGEDPTLAEDLIRALPEAPDEERARLVLRFLSHRTPAVRRAAAAALATLWGPRSRPRLAQALDDVDEGVRMAAVAGLRRVGGVDAEVVERIGRILSGVAPAGDDLCATAAAALADAPDDVKPAALEVLARAIEPKTRGMVSRLVASARGGERVMVVETVARVLVAIGGKQGKSLVEKRAEKTAEPLRSRLFALLR